MNFNWLIFQQVCVFRLLKCLKWYHHVDQRCCYLEDMFKVISFTLEFFSHLYIHFYIFFVYVFIFWLLYNNCLRKDSSLYANCVNTSPWSTISPNGQIHKWDISATSKYIVTDNQKYSFKINLCSYTFLESLLKILAFSETLKNLTRIVVKCSALKLLIFSG